VLRKFYIPLLICSGFFLIYPAVVSAQECWAPSWWGCPWIHGDLSVYTGYSGGTKGADIVFSASNQPTGSLTELRKQLDLRGVALDVVWYLRGASQFGLKLGGGYYFGVQAPAQETVQNAGAASLARTWATTPQSGNLSAALTMQAYPALIGTIGIKYENFHANFLYPSANFGSPLGQIVDRADISLNAWTPYLELVYGTLLGRSGIDMRFGVLWSPVVLGSVDYSETVAAGLFIGGVSVPGFPASNQIGQGYLAEAFAECSVGLTNGIQAGGYAKYHTMRASSNINVGERNANIPDFIYKFDFQTQTWSVGGRLAVLF